MNDEHDHDSEHIEKGRIMDGIKNLINGASANKNSTKDPANEDSAVKEEKKASGEGPGKVETIDPTPAEGTGPSQQDKDDYHAYKGLFNDKRGFAGKTSRDRGIYPMGQKGSHGREAWREEYDDLKGRRDAFEQTDSEYKAHTGRSLADEGIKDWNSYAGLFGSYNGAFKRGPDGSAPDYDQVVRGRARSAAYRAGGGRYDDEGQFLRDRGGSFIDPNGKVGFYTDEDADFARKIGVTDEGLQAMYQEFEENGTISPETAQRFRIPPEQIQEVEEQAEAHEEEGGALPGGEGREEKKVDDISSEEEKKPEVEQKGGIFGARASATGSRQIVTGDKPSVTSQRMLDLGAAGLNMFGNMMGGANKAFSMLRGLASALTSRQLMSDPMLPARGFLDAMDQSGQIIEDHIKNVGEFYGIKDGVKSEDLVGTYKGAQYYREKQAMENAERQYYAGVGNALSAVLGQRVDVNDPVAVQNALAGMDANTLKDLDDQLFGPNGAFTTEMNTLMGASNPTKVQMTQAKLLQGLNKALKGQAQSVAREASGRRRDATARAQAKRVELRGKGQDQKDLVSRASKFITNPASMAGMSYDDQQSTIVMAVLGNRLHNGTLPYNRTGQNTADVDLNTIDNNALRALKDALSNSPLMNDPKTAKAARDIYNIATGRLNTAMMNNAQQRATQRQAILNSQLAPFVNSPLDLSMKKYSPNIRRDSHGIPEAAGARHDLEELAHGIIWDIQNGNANGTADDIAMCENVIAMCRMADMKEELTGDLRTAREKGYASSTELDLMRRAMYSNYDRMASALALTKNDRDFRALQGLPWQQGTDSRYAESGMRAIAHRMEYIMGTDRRAREQAKQAKQAEEWRKEQAKITQQNDAAAQWEKDSKRDTRGISMAPWTEKDEYRKADLKRFGEDIKRIERDIAEANADPYATPDRILNLWSAKLDTEEKIRQTHQESHLQKLIAAAAPLDPATQQAVFNKVDALRDTEPDWAKFGKAINDIRAEFGLPSDRAWASSRRAEEAAQRAARQDALIGEIQGMRTDMRQMLGTINTSIQDVGTAVGQTGKDLTKTLNSVAKGIKWKITNNRTQLQSFLMGRNKDGKKFRASVEDFIKDQVVNELKTSYENTTKAFVDTITGSITDGCSGIKDTIADLDDTVKNKLEPHLHNIDWSVKDISGKLQSYMNASEADRKRIIADIASSSADISQKIGEVVNAINDIEPLGGMQVQDDQKPVKIDDEQFNELKEQGEYLKNIKESLDEIKNRVGNGQMDEQQTIALLACAMSGYGLTDDTGEGSVDYDPEQTKEFIEKMMTMADDVHYLRENIEEFNRNRDRWAVPASLVDDISATILKSEEAQAQPQSAFDNNDVRETEETPQIETPVETEVPDDYTLDNVNPGSSTEGGAEQPQITPKEEEQDEPSYEEAGGEIWNIPFEPSDFPNDIEAYKVDLWRSNYSDLLNGAPSSLSRDEAKSILDGFLDAESRPEAAQLLDDLREKYKNDPQMDPFLVSAEGFASRINTARYKDAYASGHPTYRSGEDPEDKVWREFRERQAEKERRENETPKEKREREAREKARNNAIKMVSDTFGMDLSNEEDKDVLDIIQNNLLTTRTTPGGKTQNPMADILPTSHSKLIAHKSRYVQALEDLKANGSDKAMELYNTMMERSVIPAMFSIAASSDRKVSEVDPDIAKEALRMGRDGEVPNVAAKYYSTDDLLDSFKSGDYTKERNTGKTVLQLAYRKAKAEKDYQDSVATFRTKTLDKIKTDLDKHTAALNEAKEKLKDIKGYGEYKKLFEEGKIDLGGLEKDYNTLKQDFSDAVAELNALKGMNSQGYEGSTIRRGDKTVPVPEDIIKEVTDARTNGVKEALENGKYEDFFKLDSDTAKAITNIKRLRTNLINDQKKKAAQTQTDTEGGGEQATETPATTVVEETETPDKTQTESKFNFTKKQKEENSKNAKAISEGLVKKLLSDNAARGVIQNPEKATVEQIAGGLRALLAPLGREEGGKQLTTIMRGLGLLTDKQQAMFNPNRPSDVQSKRLHEVAIALLKGGADKSFGTYGGSWADGVKQNSTPKEEKVEEPVVTEEKPVDTGEQQTQTEKIDSNEDVSDLF